MTVLENAMIITMTRRLLHDDTIVLKGDIAQLNIAACTKKKHWGDGTIEHNVAHTKKN